MAVVVVSEMLVTYLCHLHQDFGEVMPVVIVGGDMSITRDTIMKNLTKRRKFTFKIARKKEIINIFFSDLHLQPATGL